VNFDWIIDCYDGYYGDDDDDYYDCDGCDYFSDGGIFVSD
jgi:hypothetical protein